MPKIKTRKGLAKRIKVTGTGKLMRAAAFKSHFMDKKSSRRKRDYRSLHAVSKSDTKAVRRGLAI